MEALADFPLSLSSHHQDMDIMMITIICEQNGIVDILRLQRTTCTAPACSNQVKYENKKCDDRNTRKEIQETKHSGQIEAQSQGQEDLAESHHVNGLGSNQVKTHNSFSDDTNTTRKSRSDRTCTSVRLSASMDPMLASCLTAELRRSRNFVSLFSLSLLQNRKIMTGKRSRSQCKNNEDLHMEGCDPVAEESRLPKLYLRLRLHDATKYFKMEPDIRWSDRMLPQLSQRVQMEETFSWLSTLGGAYSSLGDNMYNCALEAGRVALRQLYLAERLGDATLRARCLLYIALSLMQRGQLAKAKRLVRQQYKFATSKWGSFDSRLVSMCLGIWHHLRHYYAKRKEI